VRAGARFGRRQNGSQRELAGVRLERGNSNRRAVLSPAARRLARRMAAVPTAAGEGVRAPGESMGALVVSGQNGVGDRWSVYAKRTAAAMGARYKCGKFRSPNGERILFVRLFAQFASIKF
jgi:hypothetical protein